MIIFLNIKIVISLLYLFILLSEPVTYTYLYYYLRSGSLLMVLLVPRDYQRVK